jgi:RNA polymerase sigma-70 factor (ECF subfamily)
MLGSAHEAEDAVQNTMLRAWRALPRFDDQAGLRPWLYRIATNVCIDMLNGRSRRALPMDVARVGTSEGRLIDRRPGSAWIEPAPDSLVLPSDGDPAERAVARESVRLAFIAALQRLAPRQRAVLILRDVLHWRAGEVAALLESTTDSVNSSLRRARAALEPIDRDSTPGQPSDDDRATLAAYVEAFERDDVNALVALLREDAIVEMPPFELWLRGAADIRDWLIAHDALRDHLLVPIQANGAPGAAVYVPTAPGGMPTAFAIHVLDVVDGRISAIRSFIDPELFVLFGLPLEHTS